MIKKVAVLLLLIVGGLVLWLYLASIRHNNVQTELQCSAIKSLGNSIICDAVIVELLKKQSIVLKDVKWRWANARLFLHLYVDKKEFDCKPIVDRIYEMASDDALKSLRPIITVQFHYGTPDTASWEPFAKQDIIIKKDSP